MKLNNKGFTFVEILVSLAILGIFVSAGYTTMAGWNKNIANFKRKLLTEDIISTIKNTVSNRGGAMQVDYSDDSAIALLSDNEKLPFAWSTNGNMVMVRDCIDTNSCPSGRYGYVAKPVTGSKGLYDLTIKITHPEWDSDKFFIVLIGD